MIWIVALGLAAWVFILTFQLGDLRSHVRSLERHIVDLKARLDAAPQPRSRAAPRPSAAAAEPRAAPERFVPPEPIRVMERPVVVAAEPLSPEAGPAPEPRPAPRDPAGPPPGEVVRAWLEENGLAWAGGAALALGGLLLVPYAAQRGLFTPPFRIGAAVVTGLVLLGASEWLRRRVGNPLAAAMTAGAGSATLYGAAWASEWLYGFIGLPVAGGLMAAVSFGLLALATVNLDDAALEWRGRRGEPPNGRGGASSA